MYLFRLASEVIQFLCFGKTTTFLGASGGACLLSSWGSWPLGIGGELLDGTVVVLGGEGLQGAPAVCMQLDDLHEERAGQLRFDRTKHLVPDGC